ncbi:hypothetical protein [Oceanobacillus profundus]|uniref:Uncharacterized protein n=1 Tax=Oceanobacillus profundus TaxID=372463 RepID=A0A417YA33_9BACI|nr:hypothetical protein [Oceanobacillus profundus]RHW29445.1 hypothetical protein D1B32_21930 [Oceanobacillus profundus]
MRVREKYLENIYKWEKEQEQREYYIEDLENHDDLTDSLVDTRVNEVYDFNLAREVWRDL